MLTSQTDACITEAYSFHHADYFSVQFRSVQI